MRRGRLPTGNPTQPPWAEAPHKDWEQRRMEVYAAQIDRMDQGIGRIVAALEETNQIDNTLILFLADNGACAEEFAQEVQPLPPTYPAGTTLTRDGRTVMRGNDPTVMPGSEDTYQSYGVPWANLSNTPFREYKHWVHEGGIATPLIAHWPAAIDDIGALRHGPGQLTDIMATCLDVAGADYPARFNGNDIIPLEGTSLVPIFDDQPNHKEALIWEHEGNKAVRRGRWKLVCKHPGDWELYDIVANRTETEESRGRACGGRSGTRRDSTMHGRALRCQTLGAHAGKNEERDGGEREEVGFSRAFPRDCMSNPAVRPRPGRGCLPSEGCLRPGQARRVAWARPSALPRHAGRDKPVPLRSHPGNAGRDKPVPYGAPRVRDGDKPVPYGRSPVRGTGQARPPTVAPRHAGRDKPVPTVAPRRAGTGPRVAPRYAGRDKAVPYGRTPVRGVGQGRPVRSLRSGNPASRWRGHMALPWILTRLRQAARSREIQWQVSEDTTS